MKTYVHGCGPELSQPIHTLYGSNQNAETASEEPSPNSPGRIVPELGAIAEGVLLEPLPAALARKTAKWGGDRGG